MLLYWSWIILGMFCLVALSKEPFEERQSQRECSGVFLKQGCICVLPICCHAPLVACEATKNIPTGGNAIGFHHELSHCWTSHPCYAFVDKGLRFVSTLEIIQRQNKRSKIWNAATSHCCNGWNIWSPVNNPPVYICILYEIEVSPSYKWALCGKRCLD